MAKKAKSRIRRPKKPFYSKHRNYLDPAYAKWRKDVKKRDGYSCQWPNCGSKKQLQVHHIKIWAQNPGLRYTMANGITLCKSCHEKIKGKEHFYEAFFFKLLEAQMLNKIKRMKKSDD